MKLFLLTLLFLIPSWNNDTCDEKILIASTEKSDVIVVGKILEVEESPGMASSGQLLVIQRVNYKIEKVLKGTVAGEEINVGHLLVTNSISTTDDDKGVRLSGKLFAKDNRLILFLSKDIKKSYVQRSTLTSYEKFMALNENCVLAAEPAEIAKIEALLSANGDKK